MSTARPFKFDAEKALEVLLYISKYAPNPTIYHVGKILYFADKHHLEEYGRLICGDGYCAMKDGPVPSGTYDLIKDVRDNRKSPNVERAKQAFSVDGYRVIPSREPDLSFMSESDLECLNRAIDEVGRLPYGKLREISHDDAYYSADLNGEIPIEAIAKTLRDSEELLEELQDW